MELSGASLNPDLGEHLASLGVLRERLLVREPASRSARGALRRRQGILLEAVTDVLKLAGKPLRVREVHAAVEDLLRDQVPFSSVNEALSTHCGGADPRFQRVRYGSYEVRGERT